MSSTKKKTRSVINIPEMSPPALTTTQLCPSAATDVSNTMELSRDNNYSLLQNLNRSSTYSFLDPADQAILQANDSKERRKKEETRMELEKIQERIHYTLLEYQPDTSERVDTPSIQDIDLHSVQGPDELYRLLRDVRLRNKYQQQVTVLLLGHEAALEDRERLLHSIHEFFQETQAGNTTQLLEELSSEEIDLDQATLGLETALKTAQAAGDRLLEIKKDMGQLFSIVQAFPDTKKGRKKLEKALLKAQEEVESLQNQLTTVQGELDGSSEKIGRLQRQIETKTNECEKLRKIASQVEQLQKNNTGLQSEIACAKQEAEKTKTELERERKEKLQLLAKKQDVKEVVREVEKPVDSDRVSELEAALENERVNVATLQSKVESIQSEFQEEKEVLVTEHEAEIQEMRCRYEDQMKSLMEDDIFSEMGSVAVEEEEIDADDRGEVNFTTDELQMDTSNNDLSSGSAVERLKQEHQQREIKLKEELNEVKNKSRKTITGLKVQLTEAQNRLSDESSDFHKQIDVLEKEKETISIDRDEKHNKITSLEEIITSLESQLAEMKLFVEEKDDCIHQLQRDLETALTTRFEGRPDNRLMQLVNQSAQWSEKSPSTQPHSRPLSPSSFPIHPMDEVPLSCEPSTTRLPVDGHLSMQSHHLPGLQTPLSEGSQVPGGGHHFFHGSLDQSISSHHDQLFGSTLGETPPTGTTAPHGHTQPPNALHMFAQSRLSHYSSQGGAGGGGRTSASLSHDHPVILEWVKAYDLVMKFRDGIVKMLSEDDRFKSEVEDLCSIEGAPMERDQEVQGQVTQMSFSLKLIVHQMEVTLQESINKLLHGDINIEEQEEEGEGEEEIKKLRISQGQLRKKLKQTEDLHKMELQESKETIANLYNKVETLRMEIANLRHTMNTSDRANGSTELPLAMFTSLDVAHNTRELESAVNADQISSEDYQQLREDMNVYLTIPSQRLMFLGRRKRQKKLADSLVCHIQKHYKNDDSSVTMETLVERVRSHDQLKQNEFHQKMEDMRIKRMSLARELTIKLGEMEGLTNLLLIKPIYNCNRSNVRQQQELITPLLRPVPAHKLKPSQSPHSRPKTQTGKSLVRDKEGSRQSHHLNKRQFENQVIASSTAHRPDTHERARNSKAVSYLTTPLPSSTSPHISAHPLNQLQKRRMREGGRDIVGEWDVDTSRPPTRQEYQPFSPLMFHAPPVIPDILQMDTNRKRCLIGLLERLRLPTPATPSTRQQQTQSSIINSKLTVHTGRDSNRPLSHPHPLPPINVPLTTTSLY